MRDKPSSNAQSSVVNVDPLLIHRLGVAALYAIAGIAAIKVLALPEAQKDLISLLATGAIFASFGSAISTLGSQWERDLLDRVRLNIDILYKDILRQEAPWRRWPFLRRSGKRRLLDGAVHTGILCNPEVALDVGTHVIRVALPTVLEDFFDLPLRMNFGRLARFRAAAGTTFARRKKGEVNEETKMERSDELMAYECLYDTWRSILNFRIARYVTHLGAGFAIAGALVTAVHVVMKFA